jgi:hypothetical protein
MSKRLRTEVVVAAELNDKKIVALVDTGSNITLIHSEVVGDAKEQDADHRFTVDFSRTVKRNVTFMTGMGVSRDALAVGLKIGGMPLVKKTVVTIADLHQTIPNFPPEIDMIVGTNALHGKILKIETGMPPQLLSRAGLSDLRKSESLLEVDTIDTMCDLPRDALGPLFMLRIHNAPPNTVFLADTGNKFSSFCLENKTGEGGETEEEDAPDSPSFCGVGLDATKCFSCGETNIQIRARGPDDAEYAPLPVRQKLKTIPPPASLTSIEKWCQDERGAAIDIQGNLGIDFWAGYMRISVFDFDKRKLFCVPKTK